MKKEAMKKEAMKKETMKRINQTYRKQHKITERAIRCKAGMGRLRCFQFKFISNQKSKASIWRFSFVLLLCVLTPNVNAIKQYSQSQLADMAAVGEYPEAGIWRSTRTKELPFNKCVKTIRVATGEIVNRYPVKVLLASENMQAWRIWFKDGIVTMTCIKDSRELKVVNLAYR